MYYTYILFSKDLNKYYVGYTSNLEKRLDEHGKDISKFTGKNNDWILIKHFELETKTEAIRLENKINEERN